MQPLSETAVLNLMRRVWETGSERRDRTGVGTRALFGETLRFDLSDGSIPLLTTKRVFWKSAVKELIWFLDGGTSIRPLVQQGVHIWTDWPLDKYRRETGEHISRDDFEARIIADDAFGAISAPSMASSGAAGRGRTAARTTRSPPWWRG
jgi:thymidylate synthase